MFEPGPYCLHSNFLTPFSSQSPTICLLPTEIAKVMITGYLPCGQIQQEPFSVFSFLTRGFCMPLWTQFSHFALNDNPLPWLPPNTTVLAQYQLWTSFSPSFPSKVLNLHIFPLPGKSNPWIGYLWNQIQFICCQYTKLIPRLEHFWEPYSYRQLPNRGTRYTHPWLK